MIEKKYKYAIQHRINATWVLKYKQVNQDNIEIIQHTRDDSFEHKKYPHFLLIEAKTSETNRLVTHATIEDYTYNVKNKQNIFSYNSYEKCKEE